jgi:hypothetical protein
MSSVFFHDLDFDEEDAFAAPSPNGDNQICMPPNLPSISGLGWEGVTMEETRHEFPDDD